ncbi:MAG: flagellar motor protein [Chromatiales bacterium]
MDFLSLIGILIAFLAILGGNWLEGGHAASLLNGPALAIVLGGTFGAILLQTPIPIFIRAMRMSGSVFRPPRLPVQDTITKLVKWSQIARRDGLLGLENATRLEKDRFIKKGVELLVDGNEPEVIRNVLEVEVDSRESRDLQATRVFESMGGYAPTIGILGAVMGLIHVMQNLGDPEKLGSGIATAFVATIYGVGLANLFLLPFANKLKNQIAQRTLFLEMVIEGIVSIAEGENPRHIQAKLQGFEH